MRGQLQQQCSLKQEAFQQLDKLQNDVEAALPRGASTAGKSLPGSADTQQDDRPTARFACKILSASDILDLTFHSYFLGIVISQVKAGLIARCQSAD